MFGLFQGSRLRSIWLGVRDDFRNRSLFITVPLIVLATLMLSRDALNSRPITMPAARTGIYLWGQEVPFVLAWRWR